jgi:hypothetical protein
MPALTFAPEQLTAAIRVPAGPYTPVAVRNVGRLESSSRTLSLTVSAEGGFEGTAALAKAGGAAWLTIPETCEHGIAFGVVVDVHDLPAGRHSETIEATKAGLTPGTCIVTVDAVPSGYPPR